MNLQSAKKILKYAVADGQIDEVIKLAITVVLEHLPEPVPVPPVLEIWRDIRGYEGIYQVSNLGRVKSLRFDREIILRPRTVRGGYKNVCLCLNGNDSTRQVHRLVAEAFLPNPNNLPQVDHLDNNPSNNCVENLEWVTNSENMKRAYQRGRKSPMFYRYQKNQNV